jgi:hypothetical protein
MKILENKVDIEAAQKQLETVLQSLKPEDIPVQIGYKGGNVRGKASYLKEHGIWFHFGGAIEGDGGRKRYWNVFGLDKPKEHSNVSIIVEINPPVEGIDRRDSGAFAKDDKGNIFLLQRGRIGGGKERIGKKLFSEKYDGEWAEVEDGDEKSELAVIGNISSDDFVGKLSDFVKSVDNIKRNAC